MAPNPLLQNLDVAAIELANHLSEGSLALLIGAGASKGVGMPVWWELVERCVSRAGITTRAPISSTSPNEALRSAAEGVERAAGSFERFRDIVTASLYEGVTFEESIIGERLLIALGALLMGSRRGRIRTVINFNFDDVLEWYLHLHGFQVQVVSRMPALIRETDVLTYHPHGFLPQMVFKELVSDFLLLSQFSYDERLGASRDLWLDLTKQTLREKVGLFVGLSGNDPTFGPILVDVQKSVGSNRPTGFWLLGPEFADGDAFESRNVVPLRFETFEQIPNFLLKVCQIAASG